MMRNYIRTRPFKVTVIVVLVVVAVYLKGEKFTVGALIARIADLLSEMAVERTFHKE